MGDVIKCQAPIRLAWFIDLSLATVHEVLLADYFQSSFPENVVRHLHFHVECLIG